MYFSYKHNEWSLYTGKATQGGQYTQNLLIVLDTWMIETDNTFMI